MSGKRHESTARAVGLVKRGMGVAAAAKKSKVHRTTLYRAIKAAGIAVIKGGK